MDKADISWMLVSTLLVLMMAVPGLALFYGGLVRSKNMLSVLMQVTCTFTLGLILWFAYGYSLAFTDGNAFFGGFSRVFFSGIFNPADGKYAMSSTLTEILYASFQATFAGITCSLIVGSFAERARFSAVLVFTAIWFTFAYVPIAHMVWYSVPTGQQGTSGLLAAAGALDFAGGTVVHINAGIAGLVGAYVIGKRVGYGREAMQPHNLVMTYTGAMLLWVGWFGFNAGSANASNELATMAFFNTMIATAAASLAWLFTEWAIKGKASMLGAASGAVAGLVGITPAAGFVGPVGAFVLGIAVGIICVWGVNGLKRMLKADDALDVFGVHGVGGICGALLTGVFSAKGLGGLSLDSLGAIGGQVLIQLEAIVTTLVWSGIVALIAYKIADKLCGLRVPEDEEREGLDITTHGESAYHS